MVVPLGYVICPLGILSLKPDNSFIDVWYCRWREQSTRTLRWKIYFVVEPYICITIFAVTIQRDWHDLKY